MYRQLTTAILVISLGLSAGASAVWGQETGAIDNRSVPTSLVSILADPPAYHGKRVRTIGVLFVEPGVSPDSGTHALFLTKEHMEHFVIENALSLDLSTSEFSDSLSELNGEYAIVEGRVDTREKGHVGLFVAGLTEVNRIGVLGSRE